MNIQETLQQKLGKEIAQASNEEIYGALLSMVQEMAGEKERTDSKKKLYYISAEFLIGKLLSNNMINLGIFNEVKDVLAQNGKNIAEIEEVEPEPSLGNGGFYSCRYNYDFGGEKCGCTILEQELIKAVYKILEVNIAALSDCEKMENVLQSAMDKELKKCDVQI